MSVLRQAPHFALEVAVELARELYGLDVVASPLSSERDQNFRLRTAAGDELVLKIANAAESLDLLDAQNAAMTHVASRGVATQRIVATRAGDAIATIAAPSGAKHLVRLVTWLPGTPLAALGERPAPLLEDLGRHVAQLDRALATFDHPAIHRDFYWDLANGPRLVRRQLPLVADASLRGLVDALIDRYDRTVAPLVPELRWTAIHNDPNDYNVLVSRDGLGARIEGIIDFGDLVHSYTVGDLAVAIAYAVLDAPDPLRTAAAIVRGYHREHPLTDAEISALFGLVGLRLAMSVCIAADQQRERPDDEYLTVSQEPIRRTLPRLCAIDERKAEAVFRRACALAARRVWLGPNLVLAYRDPVKIVRGSMQYLFDDEGRRYIDAYNNVPHVGHCHPRVVEAAANQMRLLNANTRYLHDAVNRFAERLAATLPEPLRICYFVNSGSEANELALRLARAHTKGRDVIVLEGAYHGHTSTLIEISPYKFNGPGGRGQAEWVHVAPIADVYRGRFRRDDPEAGRKYADFVGEIVDTLAYRGSGPAAFIAESAPSVAGQIIFPPGYLKAVYSHVRGAGGVCIADEVQTAYGRLGTHFYAFEAQGVVPDIVALGKPIGNGHPIGAVVTTREIAASFDNGMEFFSTFGGNTVSCVVGAAVLDVLEDERLQAHAGRVGERLLAALAGLQDRHAIVGDVRGSGLFLGVELVCSRETLEPATAEAADIVNRMREEGILLGTDGPFDNVLKIRPPMPFNEDDADVLVETLDRALSRAEGLGLRA